MKTMSQLFVFTISLMMLGSFAYAVEESTGAPMDPVMAEKMEKMKAVMAPSEAHKALEPFVGKWTYTGQFWMTPDSPAQLMSGTGENEMIYGGRFLKQEFEGPWMGETFQGLGYTGYDNLKREYETVWLDSMATGMMKVSGQYDAATKTLTQSGANSCPLTGETARQGRSTWTVIDADHNTYTSYMVGPDGKEAKMMEINYTRVI